MKLFGKKILIYFAALLTVGIAFQNCGKQSNTNLTSKQNSSENSQDINLSKFNSQSVKSVTAEDEEPTLVFNTASLDLNTQLLQISGETPDLGQSNASDYITSLALSKISAGENSNVSGSPTTFNGVEISTPNPSCSGSDPQIHIRDFTFDTVNSTFSAVILVCNYSSGGLADDWSFSVGIINTTNGRTAQTVGALQNFTDLLIPISFDSFDKVKLALDDSNGTLDIEATVSDLAFESGDDIAVTVNLANSDNNESAAGDATAAASDSDNAVFNASPSCSGSESEVLIQSVAISTDNGAKKISIQAKACDFSHQAPVQNPQAWSISLGLSTDEQAGSAQSPVLEFDFTDQAGEELEQKILAAKAKLAALVAAKGALYSKKAHHQKQASYHQSRINSLNRSIASWNRAIKTNQKRIKTAQKKKRKTKSRAAKKRHDKNIRRYKNNIKNYRKRISSARRSISSHTSARNSHNAAVNSTQAQINQKMAEISAAQAELDALIAQRDAA